MVGSIFLHGLCETYEFYGFFLNNEKFTQFRIVFNNIIHHSF